MDLTIAQADGKTENLKILQPLNEKQAIKRFADGLRNKWLSTIIAARKFDSLKDAIQTAIDEETTTPSTSGDIFAINRKSNKSFSGTHSTSNRQSRGASTYNRRTFHRGNTFYRGRGGAHQNYGRGGAYQNYGRGGTYQRGRGQSSFRGNYSKFNNRHNYYREQQGARQNANIHVLNDQPKENTTVEEIKFFRE